MGDCSGVWKGVWLSGPAVLCEGLGLNSKLCEPDDRVSDGKTRCGTGGEWEASGSESEEGVSDRVLDRRVFLG